MIKRSGHFFCIVLVIMLTGCAAKAVSQATVLDDADWYMNEGVQAFAEADRNHATLFFIQALALYEGIDDQQGIVNSQINLAEVDLSAREYKKAQTHLNRAAVAANSAGLENLLPRIMLLNAEIALQQQQYTEAERLLQSLLPDFGEHLSVEKIDSIQLAAIANQTRIVFVLGGDESLWTQRFAQALQVSDLQVPDLEARLLRFQAILLQRHGDFDAAESYYHRALVNYKASFSRSGIAATLAELGQLYILQGRWQDAQEYLQRANKVFRYVGDMQKVMLITESLVEVEAALGNLQQSRLLHDELVKMKADASGRGMKSVVKDERIDGH
jgi:tetratricopeptide (TPR) repeat protein